MQDVHTSELAHESAATVTALSLTCFHGNHVSGLLANTEVARVLQYAPACAGLAGSVLEERLNRTEALHWYCAKQHDWQVMWLSIQAASRVDCFLDELLVKYDPQTKRSALSCQKMQAFAPLVNHL